MGHSLEKTIEEAKKSLLAYQFPDGYWWFTLESNESIGAGYIQLMHFLGSVEPPVQKGLATRILSQQREDGSWGIYTDAPGDLSVSVECYLALKLAGLRSQDASLIKAKKFILSQGGLKACRVFTRIHLALLGLGAWDACPMMPPEMIFMPPQIPLNIYDFSSWSRTSIVPLLVVFADRPVVKVPGMSLEELQGDLKVNPLFNGRLPGWEFLFSKLDSGLKFIERLPWKPLRAKAVKQCLGWTWRHIQKTEDIFPALAYGAMAFKTAGYDLQSPQIRKSLKALRSFQHSYNEDLPPVPIDARGAYTIHQQACISPLWDTPWVILALLEAGLPAFHPDLLRAGSWLISKQITKTRGDWSIRNEKAKPGGWSFEFENEYFPDVDDTIQVLMSLQTLSLPAQQKAPAIHRGLQWLLSMQNDDGGWGAFDKNNHLELVNRIPFADQGACLDPSTPDVTGRALECLRRFGYKGSSATIRRATDFLLDTQADFGGWFGRWGINYIYGTWCVLQGIQNLSRVRLKARVAKAAKWLLEIQKADGGWGESPESYPQKRYLPWHRSVPSQTAWALMGLMAAGESKAEALQRGIDFLVKSFSGGSWKEADFTGTGFPGHFYIRYHGYRHYFPLLALAKYLACTKP